MKRPTPAAKAAMVADPDSPPVALCAGRWQLFDSTFAADHQRAAQFCAVCPMRAKCEDILLETRQEQIIAGASYGPHGTWAGKLIGVEGRKKP